MNKWPQLVEAALNRPPGARYFRCALQVNPFEYVQRNLKGNAFADEDKYNNALLDALQTHSIEVIAITDHYRVKSGERLAAAARKRGINIFGGFEAVTKDGVHVLCLFDPTDSISKIDRIIGECGIHSDEDPSPTGSKDTDELLNACMEKWNSIAIAAHVCSIVFLT